LSTVDLVLTVDEWMHGPIFGLHEVPNPLVCHYTSLGGATGIALMKALAMSPLARLNDPRESRDIEINAYTSSSSRSMSPRSVPPHELLGFRDLVANRRRQVRVGCFTRDVRGPEPPYGRARRADRRGFARPAVWAHYGDRHRGICLVWPL
jgi:hypothetical protein